MTRGPILLPIILLILSLAAVTWSQEQPAEDEPQQQSGEKVFNLRHGVDGSTDSEEELDEEERFVPRIEAGKIEASVMLGFLNLEHTLLQHDSIIYKYTDEATYWGDINLKGQSAFNPILRIGYTLTPWITLEGYLGISFCEFTTEITNRGRRENSPDAEPDPTEPELGEFDAEERSAVTFNSGLDLTWYFLNMGDKERRFHPYLIGGVGRMWYDLDSAYTLGAASTWDLSGGIGFRYIADDLISIRFDIIYHHNTVQFEPAEYFTTVNEGTQEIPLTTEPDGTPVTEYAANTVNSLAWAVGFIASF